METDNWGSSGLHVETHTIHYLYIVSHRYCNVIFHCYAVDTQIYLSCSVDDMQSALGRMESCVAEVSSWMASNYLRLNNNKAEIVLISRKG